MQVGHHIYFVCLLVVPLNLRPVYLQKLPVKLIIIILLWSTPTKHTMLQTNRTLSSFFSLKKKINDYVIKHFILASLFKSTYNWQVLQEPLKLRVWFSNPNETTPLKYVDEVYEKVIWKEELDRTIPSIYLRHSGLIIACYNWRAGCKNLVSNDFRPIFIFAQN